MTYSRQTIEELHGLTDCVWTAARDSTGLFVVTCAGLWCGEQVAFKHGTRALDDAACERRAMVGFAREALEAAAASVGIKREAPPPTLAHEANLWLSVYLPASAAHGAKDEARIEASAALAEFRKISRIEVGGDQDDGAEDAAD